MAAAPAKQWILDASKPTRYPPPGGLRRVLGRLVPQGAALRVSRPITSAMQPVSRMKAKRIDPGLARGVHLGCGSNYLAGWTNVDVLGWKTDLAWDLGSPLPFPDGGFLAAYSEHVIEHMPYDAAVNLLTEAYRITAPGSPTRISVPDAGKYIRSYVNGDGFLSTVVPNAPTPLLAASRVLYAHGHVSAWDAETLIAVMTDIGFRNVEEKQFGDSKIADCPDQESRRPESLYVEGFR